MQTLTPAEAKALKIAQAWNTKYPPGTPVTYWTGVREGEGKKSRTRTNADIRGGTAVVWVNFHASCIALSHVEARGEGVNPFTPQQHKAFFELVERYRPGSTYGEVDFRRFEATCQAFEVAIKKLKADIRELKYGPM